jgi:hypothetical protein
MNSMIRCPEGHFFDPAKHSSCPWCAKPIDFSAPAVPDVAAGKTVALQPPIDPEGKTVPYPAGGLTAPTRRLVREELGIDPVIGWLVCLDGPDKGRDFRLHTEKNFIGRAPSMDVSVVGDDTISREKHATVIFEPKRGEFWLIPGDSSGLVYLNGEVKYGPSQIRTRDIIDIGRTKLMLVAFAGEYFQWQ